MRIMCDIIPEELKKNKLKHKHLISRHPRRIAKFVILFGVDKFMVENKIYFIFV